MAPKKKATARKTSAKKTTAKKSTARKVTAKKATAKKASAKKATAKAAAPKKQPTTSIKNAMKKTEILNYISESTTLSKKEISGVFDTLGNLMHRHLKKNAAGEFTLPGVCKFKVKRRPAKKARKGINPFTGEEMMFKAKPATNVVKVSPLKKVKEMAQ